MNAETLIIRPARPEDRKSVQSFAAKEWYGGDYIEFVWDEWLEDPKGSMFVGTWEGKPVAMIKISDAGHGDGWLHGLRVSEEARKHGFGRKMLAHVLQVAQEEGYRSVRFMTSDDNAAVHHIATALGFRPVASGLWFFGQPTGGGASLVPLDELHLDWLVEQVSESPLLKKTSGLYTFRWRTQVLNPGRLRDHLLMGEVYTLPGGNAWTILDLDEPSLGYAQGPQEELVTLLRTVLAHDDLEEDANLPVLAPPDSELAQALLDAGYQQEEHGEICYEWAPVLVG